MLKSIQDVHENFFKIFRPSVIVGGVTIPTIYAKKSKKSNRSKPIEKYPTIVLMDGSVNPGKDWRPNEQKLYFENEAGDVAETMDPFQLIFEYQVSAYFEDVQHQWAFDSWVFKKFRAFGGLKLADESNVTYKMRHQSTERADGIFEVHLNFELEALVYLEDETVVELVEEFNIRANKELITIKSEE